MEGENKSESSDSSYYGDDERSESSLDSLEILREAFLEYNDVSSMSTSPEQSPESKRVCDLLISKLVEDDEEERERQRKEAQKETDKLIDKLLAEKKQYEDEKKRREDARNRVFLATGKQDQRIKKPMTWSQWIN